MEEIRNSIKVVDKSKQKVYIHPKKLLALNNFNFESCTITKTEVAESGKTLFHGNNQTKNPTNLAQGKNILLSTRNILNKNTDHIVEMLDIENIQDLYLTNHIQSSNGKHTYKLAFRYGHLNYDVQLCAQLCA